MTQNQKTLLGVGVLAVAGYLVYANNKKSSFLPQPSTRVFANASGMEGMTVIEIIDECRVCVKGSTLIREGQPPLYECAGGFGRFGKKCATFTKPRKSPESAGKSSSFGLGL